jgi:hypothetical protein
MRKNLRQLEPVPMAPERPLRQNRANPGRVTLTGIRFFSEICALDFETALP